MAKEWELILEKHKGRLLEALRRIFERIADVEIGMTKEDLFGMFEEAAQRGIEYNRETIPEYYTVYGDFRSELINQLDRLEDMGMTDAVARKIMELVNSHTVEAMKEVGLEGQVEARRSIMPPAPELQVPDKFRK